MCPYSATSAPSLVVHVGIHQHIQGARLGSHQADLSDAPRPKMFLHALSEDTKSNVSGTMDME